METIVAFFRAADHSTDRTPTTMARDWAALRRSLDGFRAGPALTSRAIVRCGEALFRATRQVSCEDRVWSGPRAVGILIFPKIVRAGFIFGAQGGRGALAVGRRWRGCYTIGAASFEPQAGVEWFR